MRQGDPLSPLLFNIAIELLLSILRQKLSGISLPGSCFKVSAFADDVVMGLGSSQDFQLAQECLVTYSSASNAKLNVDKCQTLILGGGNALGLSFFFFFFFFRTSKGLCTGSEGTTTPKSTRSCTWLHSPEGITLR